MPPPLAHVLRKPSRKRTQEEFYEQASYSRLIVGALFAVMITWVATFDAFEMGGLALLASVVFDLAAGLCIGALIAANFAMLAAEEKQEQQAVARRHVHAHA